MKRLSMMLAGLFLSVGMALLLAPPFRWLAILALVPLPIMMVTSHSKYQRV